jgi:hypothetical protein
MAMFKYTGWAMIIWKDKDHTRQYIDFCANTGTLRVWPDDNTIEEHEYLGQMKDHPADMITFSHGY